MTAPTNTAVAEPSTSDLLASYGLRHEPGQTLSRRYIYWRDRPLGLMNVREAINLLDLLAAVEAGECS